MAKSWYDKILEGAGLKDPPKKKTKKPPATSAGIRAQVKDLAGRAAARAKLGDAQRAVQDAAAQASVARDIARRAKTEDARVNALLARADLLEAREAYETLRIQAGGRPRKGRG